MRSFVASEHIDQTSVFAETPARDQFPDAQMAQHPNILLH